MGYFKDLIVRIKGDAKPLKKETKKAEGNLRGFGKNVKGIGSKMGAMFAGLGAAIGAAFAVKGLVKFGSDSVRLYDEQIKALTKVSTAVKATGNAAGFTTQELADTASELKNITTFGDEEILGGVTAQLLTFTNIAGDQFKRTQKAALDLATMLDGDLKSTTIQLGKALNDPVSNLSALSESGIQFSESQKEIIKRLAETNDLAGAQTIILDELNKQYGGQAEAQAKVGLGPWKQVKNTIGDLKEEFGKGLIPITNKFAGFVKAALPKIADAFRSVGAAVRRLRNGFADVYNNSLILRAGIAMMGAQIKTVFAAAKLAIQQAFLPIKTIGKVIGAVLKGQFREIPNIIKDGFKQGATNIKQFGTKAANNYGDAIEKARSGFIEPLKPTESDIKSTAAGFKKAGTAAADAFVDAEADQLKAREAERERNKIGELGSGAEEIQRSRKERIESVKGAMPGSGIQPGQIQGSTLPEIDTEAFESSIERSETLLDSLRGTVSEFATEGGWGIHAMAVGFDELGMAIGEAFSQAEADGLSFGATMAQVAKRVIKAFIAEGVAAIIAKTLSGATGLLGPLALPIAGAAGSAAAALFSRLIPSLAGGGIVTSPTLAMIGDNPGRKEAVIPSEMWGKIGAPQKTMKAIAHRTQLEFMLEQNEGFKNRT